MGNASCYLPHLGILNAPSAPVVPKLRKWVNLVFTQCFPHFLNHRTFPGVGERGHEKVIMLDAQVNAKTQNCYHPQDLRAGSGHCP